MNAQNFSRRSFLGAAAAAAAAAAPLAHAASVKQEIPAQWDMEADVVVLGAGGAGLMAACQAHDRGAKVVVFNKGGSSYHTGTNLCGGLFTACGSRMQKADPKIKDDWKAFADDIIAYGEHMSLKEPVYGFTKPLTGSKTTALLPIILSLMRATRMFARIVRIPSKGVITLTCSKKKSKRARLKCITACRSSKCTLMKLPTAWSAFSAAVTASSSTAEPKWAS